MVHKNNSGNKRNYFAILITTPLTDKPKSS